MFLVCAGACSQASSSKYIHKMLCYCGRHLLRGFQHTRASVLCPLGCSSFTLCLSAHPLCPSAVASDCNRGLPTLVNAQPPCFHISLPCLLCHPLAPPEHYCRCILPVFFTPGQYLSPNPISHSHYPNSCFV